MGALTLNWKKEFIMQFVFHASLVSLVSVGYAFRNKSQLNGHIEGHIPRIKIHGNKKKNRKQRNNSLQFSESYFDAI